MESKTKEAAAAVTGAAPAPDPKRKEVDVPTDSSPYVKYSDLEDYKSKGYGTSGHLPVVDRPHHGGGTDAPTLSGSGLPPQQAPHDRSN
ncbi:Late embryogenesis abundant protein 18 [Carex littledalei]|uniref:Late embryogenesis abundant protein 18 n=1 Tax=Carex littledalei TaxID=544730 RepID=A0A833VP44_9POAL|nr:Late embryogenesis abundant protein 18 [Carex littledalei]